MKLLSLRKNYKKQWTKSPTVSKASTYTKIMYFSDVPWEFSLYINCEAAERYFNKICI